MAKWMKIYERKVKELEVSIVYCVVINNEEHVCI